ncbi:hypothetical protein VTJ83DRAFT_5586 [Remersonia thermophila]|uniref:Mitochondrial chaperone BCS1 n=1 Tax=Remersonia thermophila TaxID=72144 RepID=A0ABR4D9G2_9PEZI
MDTVGPSPVSGEAFVGAAAAAAATAAGPTPIGADAGSSTPQLQLLDYFFPGFSVFSAAASKYLHIDLNLYIPLVLMFGGFTFLWRYFTEYFWGLISAHLMSVVDVRPDDECYNFLMGWVANQRFAQGARRFVVNTNLNSRSWYLWRYSDDDDDDDDDETSAEASVNGKKKALAYTPTFGSHWFVYKGRILIFRRSEPQQQSPWLTTSEREEISISCFGRNPWILKELLHEARDEFMKRDEAKTLIYRGTTKSGSSEPQWQRCMARTSRPFSTVILNEKVKKELIDDVTDYLNPATRRWYANRGIPYRRGYLLYGPPGTGKSSLSLALAGFFKMRIYIVSLSSVTANEENLATLFAELPRRCVVLLEDIDTAGLTHTREDDGQTAADGAATSDGDDSPKTSRAIPGGPPNPNAQQERNGRLSLSGLLNILDGVASQEGRVLIMTTNHLEKLDKALIRPGRVDMIVKFDLADKDMTAQIFKSLYAPIEGDDVPASKPAAQEHSSRALWQLESKLKPVVLRLTPEEERKKAAAEAEAARKRDEEIARVSKLAEEFAAKIPEHEFSPAEIQGFLLKSKRAPEKAVEGAAQWVVDRRKEKKDKEIKEAEERRKKEEEKRKEKEKEEQEKREKEEKEKEEKEEKKKAKKEKRKSSKSRRKSVKEAESRDGEATASEPSTDSDSGSSESEAEEKKRKRRNEKAAKKRGKPAATADAYAAPGEPKETAPEAKAASVPVVVTPAMAVDTDKAKEAVDKPQQTPEVDSGYGTPS